VTASVLLVAASLVWIGRSDRPDLSRAREASSAPTVAVANQIEFVDMAGEEAQPGAPPASSGPRASSRRVKSPKVKAAPSAAPSVQDAARKEKVWLE
jgi:hypothetical protein